MCQQRLMMINGGMEIKASPSNNPEMSVKWRQSQGENRGLLANSALCELNCLDDSGCECVSLCMDTSQSTYTYICVRTWKNVNAVSLKPSWGQEFWCVHLWAAKCSFTVKALSILPTSWPFLLSLIWGPLGGGTLRINGTWVDDYGFRQHFNNNSTGILSDYLYMVLTNLTEASEF